MRKYFDKHINDYVYDAGTPEWLVKAVQPQEDYTLILTFINGERKIYDARPLLEKPLFAPLKDLSFFMQAKSDGSSVFWSDELDIAPEHLYEKARA